MKKYLFISLLLLSGILLVACGKKSWEVNENVNYTDIKSNNCMKTVERYLKWADKKWSWEEVKKWDNIIVDYIWRLEDGTVFDTSIKYIAEVCGIYDESKNYTDGLSIQAWAWQVVKWFDNWVIWMKIWQTKTVQFWPEEWYWEYDKNAVVKSLVTEVWDVSQFKEWDNINLWYWMIAKIVKMTDKEVTLDMNHELAGKNLIFDITVKSIN